MSKDTRGEQAARVIAALESAGLAFTAGPLPCEVGPGSFVRIIGGPSFQGEDLLDALSQAATWVLHR